APRAVRAFEQGLAGARWSESRLPLIRALIRTGDVSRAEQLLKSAVEHPVAIYAGPEPQAPGLWREAIVELTTLVSGQAPTEAGSVHQKFSPLLGGKTRAGGAKVQLPR